MLETQVILDTVRDFCKRKIEPLSEKIDKEDWYPRDLVREMGYAGILNPFYNGVDLYTSMLVLEEIAKASGSVALIQDAQTELVTEAIRKFSDYDVKSLSIGDKIGSFGLSEPCCGSDTPSMRTMAVKKDKWIINGEKMWITQGLYADVFLVAAKVENNINAFLVNRDSCVTVSKIEVMGNRGTGTADVKFDGCEGERIGGWEVIKYALNLGRIAISSIALGLAEAAIEEALQWSNTRIVFGKKIIEHQGNLWKISDSISKILMLKGFLKYVCDNPNDYLISSLKLQSSRLSQEIVDNSLQLMGGMGYAKGNKIERIYRDVRLTRIGEGSDEVQLYILSKNLDKISHDINRVV
jgi:alkylation response protein AidB-like acyl-CoA dehydrogenase